MLLFTQTRGFGTRVSGRVGFYPKLKFVDGSGRVIHFSGRVCRVSGTRYTPNGHDDGTYDAMATKEAKDKSKKKLLYLASFHLSLP